MQHDNVLKKMNFYLLTPSPRVVGERGLRAKYLLPCCCIDDSLYFDMQHDHVLKKLNFDLLTPRSGVCVRSTTKRLNAEKNPCTGSDSDALEPMQASFV